MMTTTRSLGRRAVLLLLAASLLAGCSASDQLIPTSTPASTPTATPAAVAALAPPPAAPVAPTAVPATPVPIASPPATRPAGPTAAPSRAIEAVTAPATPVAQETGRSLRYFWPTALPQGLAVQAGQSSGDERTFTLALAQPGGGQFSATITGGPDSRAAKLPPATRSRPVTVRGQRGMAFTTGAGYSVFWTEHGQPYAITGGLGLEDVLTLAQALESLDLTTWRHRLATAR